MGVENIVFVLIHSAVRSTMESTHNDSSGHSVLACEFIMYRSIMMNVSLSVPAIIMSIFELNLSKSQVEDKNTIHENSLFQSSFV